MRSKTSTTRLPLKLREELGLATDLDRHPHGRLHHPNPKSNQHHHTPTPRRTDGSLPSFSDSRKRPASEQEHSGRAFTKRPRIDTPARDRDNNHPSKPHTKPTNRRRVSFAKDDNVKDLDHEAPRHTKASSSKVRKPQKPSKIEERAKAQTPLQRLVARQQPAERPAGSVKWLDSLDPVEKEEEDEIAWLEAKLGLKGKKKKAVEDDGLDDLLGDLDRIVHDVRGGKHNQDEDDSETYDDDDEEITESELQSESEVDSESDGDFGFSDMDSAGSSEHEADSDDNEPPILVDRSDKVDSEIPSATGRYIPPALRKARLASETAAPKSEAQIKLARQLKGLLNKLSEQNIGSIIDDIEGLYRHNVRHDVTSTLTDLILNSISSHSSLLDSFVILHAALVASLYKLVGTEFAAYFVQALVAQYEKHYDAVVDASEITADAEDEDETTTTTVKGKEASNLLVLLAELYTFQVVSCILVYDIIRSFLSSRLGEFEVELFLKLLKSIGMQLRQDDPTALKDIVLLVQAKTSGNQTQQNSRTRYMLETLMNLKNNKIVEKKQRVGQQNVHIAADAVDKMKRFIKSLASKKTVRANEPLNVTLEDLHSVDKKGKWWLVGSAWGGDPLVDAAAAKRKDEVLLEDEPLVASENQSAALLKLAKRQGMNTDVRRKIFVVLMSSEDYVDACDRLGQLKFTDQQRPEIIRVLLHCLGNEKAYNPYYTMVAQHLGGLSRNVRFSLQYCLWDLFKEFGESVRNSEEGDEEEEEKVVPKTRMRNVAKAFAWWVAKGVVALDILKPLNFFTLKTQTKAFLRMFFAQLFVSSQSASPILDFATTSDKEATSLSRDREVVEVIILKAAKHTAVVQGMLHFFDHEDVEAQPRCEAVRKTIKWGVKIARDTLEAGVEVSNL